MQRGLNDWNKTLQINKNAREGYYEQNKQIGIALAEGYFDGQAKANAMMEQSMGEKLAAQLSLMEANSAAKAKGGQGKRSNVRQIANAQAFGREQINAAEDLAKGLYYNQRSMESMQRQANNDMMNNYYRSGVGIDYSFARPVFGPAPVHGGYVQGPSALGMFGGMLNAGISGIAGFNASVAPQHRILGGFGAQYKA